MPSRRSVPESKQRSRTGCLPCRKRRRKCDEKRPLCGSCASRKVTCSYQPWTFIAHSRSLPIQLEPPINLHHEDDTSDKDPFTNGETTTEAPRGASIPTTDLLTLPDVVQPISFSLSPELAVIQRSGATPQEEISPCVVSNNHSSGSWASDSSPTLHGPLSVSTTTLHDDGDALISFRYELSPWIESGAPGCSFGVDMMELASQKQAVQDAMVFVMRTLKRCERLGTHELNERLTHREQVQHASCLEEDSTALVIRSLLSLADFFYTSPSAWGDLIARNGGGHQDGFASEPLRSLNRMLVKIELADCLLSKKAPSQELLLWSKDSPSRNELSPIESHDACLAHLAGCLYLVYHEFEQVFDDEAEDKANEPANEPAGAWTAWRTLWTECLQWFRSRSPDMSPISGTMEFTTSEVVNDPCLSFPLSLYTTPLALQANVFMHCSVLLLLTQKPRLLQLPRSERFYASQAWHCRKIAGIAIWNAFPEQWDPVITSALLLAAKEMTHPTQHHAVLNCLNIASSSMAVDLDDEIQALRSRWQTFA